MKKEGHFVGRREVLKTITLAGAAFVTGGVAQTIGQRVYASSGTETHVRQLDSAAESFAGIDTSSLQGGDQFSVRGWHENRSAGGGVFYWDPGKDKSEHNGGTVISPTVPSVSMQTGGSLADRVASFLGGAGETDAAGSGCFVRTETPVAHVELFGYGEGCELPSLLAAAAFSASSGLPAHVRMTDTVSIRQVVFPPGCQFTRESVIDFIYDGSLVHADHMVKIHDFFQVGTLILRTINSQSRSSFSLCHVIGHDAAIGRLILDDPELATGSTAVTVSGNRFKADLMRSRNFARPFAFTGSDNSPCTGARVGRIEIENYIRGVGLTYVEDIEIDSLFMSVRHPSAAKSPGHNGILCSSVRGLSIREADVRDTGEHALRVGGNSSMTGAGHTTDININRWTVHRSGGCAIKINPNPGQRCERIYVAALIGYDVSDGLTGGNSELLRLTRTFDADFDTVATYWVDRSNGRLPVRNAVRTAESGNVHIGLLTADATHNSMISFEEVTDSAQAATRGFFIDRVVYHDQYEQTSTILVRFEANNFIPGNIFIRGVDFRSVPNSSSPAITWANPLNQLPDAPIVVQGQIEIGQNLLVNQAPDTPLVWMDVRSGNRVITAPMSFYTQRGTHVLASSAFTPANSPSNGVTISAMDANPGSGNYGGSLILSRPGSTRRGGAITIRQQTGNANDIGLAFFGGSAQVATDALRELMELYYDGALELKRNGKGIILRSPNGTPYSITVDNSGQLQVSGV